MATLKKDQEQLNTSITEPKQNFGWQELRESKNIEHVINHGTLIAAPRPPDTFYNGWYPVRGCSLVKAPSTRCGTSSSKTSEFRGYKVHCNYCDKQRPCPIDRPEKIFDSQGDKQVYEVRGGRPRQVENAHWRYHDAHDWTRRPNLTEGTNMHPFNWFREQMDSDLKGMQIKRAQNRKEWRERVAKEDREVSKYLAKLKEAQARLEEKQKKCSFNNCLTNDPPPLPGAPTHYATNVQHNVGASSTDVPVSKIIEDNTLNSLPIVGDEQSYASAPQADVDDARVERKTILNNTV